jgi:hypothetical protein
LATPIKLVGALDLGIKLGIFLDIPPKVDAPMGLGMCLLTQLIMGTALGIELHNVKDLISHQQLVVLALMY